MQQQFLLVTRDQFGYHVDPCAYARELTRHAAVTYFCWDYGRPRVEVPGVRVIYSSREGNVVERNLRFLRELMKLVGKFDRSLLFYFPGVSLVHLRAGQDRLVCDVRTGNVGASDLRRYVFDKLLRLELLTFRHRSFISEGLGRRFGFRYFNVLPLGATLTRTHTRDYASFHLLYVGTFSSRRLEEALRGFGQFRAEVGDEFPCRFTLVGSGTAEEEQRLRDTALELNLPDDALTFAGYVRRDHLAPYFRDANVGVSYVPITPYFDHQPVTKTYEYLLAGLPVIGTATSGQHSVITPENGVLIQDDPAAFAAGLHRLYHHRHGFSGTAIQQEALRYTYRNIVDHRLVPYLLRTAPRPQPAALAETLNP